MRSPKLNNMNLMWSLASSPTGHPSNPEGVGALLGLVIRGTGHTEEEVAWYSQVTFFFHVYNAVAGGRGAALAGSTPSSSSSSSSSSLSVPSSDPLSITLAALVKHRSHSSFYVRKAVVLAMTSFMLDNWSLLTEGERKSVKETFTGALHDNKPEVTQTISPYPPPPCHSSLNSYDISTGAAIGRGRDGGLPCHAAPGKATRSRSCLCLQQ